MTPELAEVLEGIALTIVLVGLWALPQWLLRRHR